MLAIIGAMQEEIELLLSDLQDPQEIHKPGAVLHKGVLDGVPVLITKCGIGKVNAALTTAYLLSEGASRVIFTGVAGGVHPHLNVGDIVVSTDLLQHDVEVLALGYKLGEVPGEPLTWEANPALRELAVQAAKDVKDIQVMEGRIASGDQFIASKEGVQRLQKEFEAACAEMEGAAVAQVCAKSKVPFVVIRSISDTADHDANVDYPTFMPKVARHAKQVVRGMLNRLKGEHSA